MSCDAVKCKAKGAVVCNGCRVARFCNPQHQEQSAAAHKQHCQGLREALEKGWSKRVVTEGEGPLPPQGAMMDMHYTGELVNGSEFDSSRGKGRTFGFELGAGEVIEGWDKGVAAMKRGERALLYLRPDHGYGKHGAEPDIPGNAFLIFDVELVSFTDEL